MHSAHISPDELREIAWILVDKHGAQAFELAGFAVAEMRDLGDDKRTNAWLALQSVISDALDGRIVKDNPLTLH
ncbi:MAG: hypothetical protein JKX99_07640 [Robiginitomaculum sp.]|nr:hypothetical protein [Robiginitomaculum sp.]